jgi:hypothetical protein
LPLLRQSGNQAPTGIPPMDRSALAQSLSASGLIVRGEANLSDPVTVPGGMRARSVFLIGHAGSSIWPHFSAWLAGQSSVPNDPLDTWSKEVIAAAADAAGGHAVFPSDKPHLPFQQWAMKAEGLKPSPLGILIHPVYGLWHAYRGAILVPEELIQSLEKLSHPCDTCLEKPCLNACPVNAFSGDRYDVSSCRSHLHSVEGHACVSGGCMARLACPVGREFAYLPDQMRFHMAAFA